MLSLTIRLIGLNRSLMRGFLLLQKLFIAFALELNLFGSVAHSALAVMMMFIVMAVCQLICALYLSFRPQYQLVEDTNSDKLMKSPWL